MFRQRDRIDRGLQFKRTKSYAPTGKPPPEKASGHIECKPIQQPTVSPSSAGPRCHRQFFAQIEDPVYRARQGCGCRTNSYRKFTSVTTIVESTARARPNRLAREKSPYLLQHQFN